MKNRVITASVILIGCVIIGLGAGMYTSRLHQAPDSTPAIQGLLWPNPPLLKQFNMVNQDGKNFSIADLKGKWSFLFFGYTHCPDVCPITLTVMKQVYQKLQDEKKSGNVQMIFISVDPKRDTTDVINSYVKYFNPDFIGLTGNEEQVNSLTGQLGIVHAITPGDEPDNYLVDHSASILLISPDAHWVGIFSAPQQVEDVLQRFLAIKNFLSK